VPAPGAAPSERLLSALIELSAAEGGVHELAPVLCELACVVADVDGAVVELVDGHEVRYLAATGLLAGTEGTRVARNGSLSGLVIASARAQVCHDTHSDMRVDRVACARLGIGSMAILPIRHAHHTIAVLKLASREPGVVDEHHVRLVEPLVQAASARLAQAEAAAGAAAQLAMLNEVAQASKQVLLAEDPGGCLVEAIARITGASQVYLLLPDSSDSLQVTRQTGAQIGPVRLRLDEQSLCGIAFRTGRPQIVSDWRTNPQVSSRVVDQLLAAGVSRATSGVYLPLETAQGPAGVVVVLMDEPITASNADLLGLLQLLAAEAGIAITRDDLRRKLADQARSDPLTGLANRRAWDERLELEVSRSARTGTPFAVAALDLDFFKRFNDTHGHPAGDELLRQVAAAWSTIVRPSDLLARLGGEEFAAVLPETDVESAAAIAARFGAVMPSGQTVSVGLTGYQPPEPAEALMQRADEALYAAKTAGRDRVVTR
jgi:diguanylate cyclase (GGDEF)-like protein